MWKKAELALGLIVTTFFGSVFLIIMALILLDAIGGWR